MCMKNVGKVFEDDFRNSMPDDVYYMKLHDSSIGFDVDNSTQRFALKSPYDFQICKNGQLYCFELKSVGEKTRSISFAGKNPIIKPHQVKELIKAKTIGGAKCGIIINFREFNETYIIDPEDFASYTAALTKKSVNYKDVVSMGRLVGQELKKTHYRFFVEDMMKAM